MGYDITKMGVGVINSLTTSMNDGGIPLVNETTASLQAAGKAILAFQARTNAFCTALANAIIASVISNKMYESHYNLFKKAEQRYGDTIQEIYFGLCEVHGYDPSQAAQNIYGINAPDVSTAFHSMDLAATYATSIADTDLERAFYSFEGWDKFVQGAIAEIYDSFEYDQELLFKYLLATVLLTGRVKVVEISEPSASTSDAITIDIKKISNDMEFKKSKYTIAKVPNFVKKSDQVLLESVDVNAILNVATLANAFHMEKADLEARTILFDSLADIDYARLAKILSKDTGYSEFTSDQKADLAKVHAVLCSKDFFMIYDNYKKMGDVYNPDGMYRNYFYNIGQTFSVSPFEDVVLFTNATNAISAVTVSGLSAISMAGTYDYSAAVTRTGFISDEVTWKVEAAQSSGVASLAKIKIDAFGRLTLESGYATGGIVITATSKADGTVAGTKAVTLS